VSNDDLGNLPPLGGNPLDGNLPPLGENPLGGDLPPLAGNPLDGDLLGDMGQPAPTSPLMGDAATSPPLADDAAAASPLFSDGIAAASPLPAEEEASAEPAAEEPAEEKPSFLAKLAESNPYTVILVASLLALLVGVLCLFLEWRSYNYDTKAKEAHQSAAHTSAPFDSGAAGASRGLTV